MPAMIRRFGIASAFVMFAASAHAVVAPGHWRLDYPPAQSTSSANLIVSVDQTIDGDDTPTLFDYDASAGTLRFVTLALDEGSELFLVKPGDLLSNHTAGTLLPSLFAFDAPSVNVGHDFYLGVGTRSYSDPGYPSVGNHSWTSFGWSHLQLNQQGRLDILGSAMAFQESGIVVGTLQAVPEPSTWTMACMGVAWLAGRLRKTRGSDKG
jgi:hypothetical protein